jgi:predicted DNA-binding transcriptional regulator YafY
MSALAKLQQVLPARLRPQVAAMGAASVLGRPGLVDAELLATLAGSCRDLEIVAFDYESRGGSASSRRVEPHQLVTTHGQWYLLAYDPSRNDWRTFRVDRMSSVRPARHRCAPRELPAPDAASYLVESFAAATYRHTARLVVQLPEATVRESFFGSLPGSVEAAGSSACEVRLSAESAALLVQYVAGIVALGADFTLEASDEVVALLRLVGERLGSG